MKKEQMLFYSQIKYFNDYVLCVLMSLKCCDMYKDQIWMKRCFVVFSCLMPCSRTCICILSLAKEKIMYIFDDKYNFVSSS